MNKEMKRWLVSSVITFLGGFVAVLATNWSMVTVDAVMDGSILGLVLVAARGGVKAVAEYFVKK